MMRRELNNGRKKRIKLSRVKSLVLEKKVLVSLFGYAKQEGKMPVWWQAWLQINSLLDLFVGFEGFTPVEPSVIWHNRTKPQFMTNNKVQAEPEMPFLWQTNLIYIKVYQLLIQFRLFLLQPDRVCIPWYPNHNSLIPPCAYQVQVNNHVCFQA